MGLRESSRVSRVSKVLGSTVSWPIRERGVEVEGAVRSELSGEGKNF